MNVNEIIELMQAVSENGLANLELKEGEFKLSLKHEKEMPQTMTVSAPSADAVSVQMAVMQNGLAGPSMMSSAMMPQDVASPRAARDMASGVDIGSDRVIASPLMGTFYNASSPDAAPFVWAGDTVRKGQVLRIIEAMKLMNEIGNEYDSVVEAVLVDNGEVVEHGRSLFRTKQHQKTEGFRGMSMEVKEIQEIVSHRHSFLLVDCTEELEPGVRVAGHKCVTYNESFFRGHFPQEPAMPDVLLVEALAQIGAVAILSQEGLRGRMTYFGGIEKAKFECKAVPGGKAKLECEIIKQKGPVGVSKVIAAVDGKLAVGAELAFMVGQGTGGERRCLTRF